MKVIFLYVFFLLSNKLMTNAQITNDGLFVNKERNEFVIIRNDTVQFRIYNDDALATFTIGEGLLKIKGKGKYIVELSTFLIEKTSILYRNPRSDDRLSIQILGQDSLPMIYVTIKLSLLKDKKPFIIDYGNENGQLFLEKKQIDYLEGKDIFIYVNLIGYTAIEKKILLEKGYDYIIKSLIPGLLSGSIASGNNWKIHKLNESEISISNGKIVTKLKKLTDKYLFSDFPFEKDLVNILEESK